MSIVSPPVRIPRSIYKEITRIQKEHGCSFRKAFEKWQKTKLGGQWQDI